MSNQWLHTYQRPVKDKSILVMLASSGARNYAQKAKLVISIMNAFAEPKAVAISGSTNALEHLVHQLLFHIAFLIFEAVF
jgi:hypothetical protein